MIQFVYGLLTLAVLWAFGASEPALFWQRQWGLAGISVIACLPFLFRNEARQALLASFKQHKKSILRWTAISSLLSILILLALWLGGSRETGLFSSYIHDFAQASLWWSVPALLISSAAAEYVVRGKLAPAWGWKGVARLEALTLGFAAQHVIVFLLVLGMAYLGDFLSKKIHLGVAVGVRALWSLSIGIFLVLLNVIA